MEIDEARNQTMKAMENYLETIFDLVFQIVDTHWELIRAMERRKPGWSEKSELQLRCTRKGNSIIISWTRVRWYGSTQKGSRIRKFEHISKPAGSHGYTLSKLLGFAKDWEKPLVQETEERLAVIRHELSLVVKALTSLRYAIRASSINVAPTVSLKMNE